jgi:SP family arabinose:H+ symporter-like MFS transporter
LIGGAAVQAVSLGIVAVAFAQGSQGWWVLVAILTYVGAFSASLGPVVWVVISEIFPTKIRGRAMGLATLSLWTACYLLSHTFPILLGSIGPPMTFGLYAGISVACAVFVAIVVPETKGMSLEDIERHWTRGRDTMTK